MQVWFIISHICRYSIVNTIRLHSLSFLDNVVVDCEAALQLSQVCSSLCYILCCWT